MKISLMCRFVILVTVAPALAGCISLAVTGHSGGKSLGSTHKPDELLAGYQLPDGSLVVELKGRLRENDGPVTFSLSVPAEEIRKARNEQCLTPSKCSNDWQTLSEASISDPPLLKTERWHPLSIQHNGGTIPRPLPPDTPAALYVNPVANIEAGKSSGHIRIVYAESLSNGAIFTLKIEPQELKEKRSLKWLPLTIPVDIVTLPLQAIWGLLVIPILAGAQ